MNTVLRQISLRKIVPVVVIDNADDARELARSLAGAGLPLAEVTFRTTAAPEAIAAMVKEEPAMLVGAGSVLNVEQVKQALDAGAKFIVSPGLGRKVVEYCLGQRVPVTPGVATPTEISAATEMGLEVVKFFPAEAMGGLGYLRAVSAPFPSMRFIPTGGIDETNILAYLAHPKVIACGGSWMVKQDLIAHHRFDEIGRLASRAVSLVTAKTVPEDEKKSKEKS